MITAGKNIKERNDQLQTLNVERLYRGLVNPKQEIVSKINQLRKVQTVSKESYRRQKTNLPYVCCGIFKPPHRRTENFAHISHFILDIDHLSEKQLDINTLREKLKQDPRVELIFVSPGGDGLKLFFRLSEKCFDPGKYSTFYRAFATAFAHQYNIDQVVDKVTSDVTRACFISYDPDAYFNPNPETIDINKYIDFENISAIAEMEKEYERQQAELKKVKKEQKPEDTNTEETPKVSKDIKIEEDKLLEIKKKLGVKVPKDKPPKIIYVPDELNQVLDKVTKHIEENGIKIDSITDIHYGKKFRFSIDEIRWVEINLHYGKRGFSVVITPKSGSNLELAEVCKQLMCEIFC